MLEARRASPWRTSTAVFIYLGIFALLVLSLLGFGIFRLVRRLRNWQVQRQLS